MDEKDKIITKNSFFLLIRLIVTTFIGLYVARIVLSELGVDNYGLFAVVGGFVAMMSFLNPSMAVTSNRFIAVEIGKKDGRPNKIFNSVLLIHITLALLVALLGETLGRWYINNHLNVSPFKIHDAFFVLRLSIASTCISIISVPFQGLITAKEKFNVRVFIELSKAFLQLGLVIWLTFHTGNKLRVYASIMMVVMLLPSLMNILYCRSTESDIVKWAFNREISDYKEIVGFSAWIMIGAIAHLSIRQGAALTINFFFGTALNAAFGIASQVYNYITMFVLNLNQAAVPQIMKSFSAGDPQRSLNLANRISKYSFFIMLMVATPILLSIDNILVLWLKNVPEFTEQFVILMIINGLVGVLGSGFDAVIQSTGNIKKFQIYYSIISLLTLPIAYIFFTFQFPPHTITAVTIFTTIFILILRIAILTNQTEFQINSYYIETIHPALLVLVFIVPLFIADALIEFNTLNNVLLSICSVPLTGIIIFIFGLTPQEKRTFKDLLKIIYSSRLLNNIWGKKE
jgi:O-antigen/teichoic acid export membrane protein